MVGDCATPKELRDYLRIVAPTARILKISKCPNERWSKSTLAMKKKSVRNRLMRIEEKRQRSTPVNAPRRSLFNSAP